MIKKIYTSLIVTTLFLTTAGLTSCEYKELEDGSVLNPLTVVFDTVKIEKTPKAMRVAFYPADDDTRANMTKGYTFFDLPRTIWPATIQLPAGLYYVTAWNNDTEHVLTDGYGNQETLHATTPAYNARGTFDTPNVLDSIYNGQRVLDYPDYMVHANEVDAFEVFYGKEHQTLVLKPDSMVITIDFRIHGIGGLSWVKQIRGAVNNVAGKRYIAYPDRTEESVAVMFDCEYNAEDSLVYGQFYVFGLEPSEITNLNHKMVLFFWMNGGKVYLPIDVTEAFRRARKEGNRVLIEIPSLGIDLRDYVSSKNTFEVNLEEWDDVKIDVGF